MSRRHAGFSREIAADLVATNVITRRENDRRNSRPFGFAEAVSKHFAVRVARLRIARREGVMDRNRDECSGYSNSGNATSFSITSKNPLQRNTNRPAHCFFSDLIS